MKYLCLPTLLILLLGHMAFSTVLTVDNKPLHNAQYSSFGAAYNDAVDGDTIYLHPSNNSYGSLSISKALTIIGAGHTHPEELISQTSSISIYSDSVTIQNLKTSSIQIHSSSVIIKSCRTRSVNIRDDAENTLVYGNVINGYLWIYFNSFETIVTNNYIFDDYYLIREGSETATIQNNVFYRTNSGPYSLFFQGSSSTFYNNIFIVESADELNFTSCSNCVFTNNLTWSPNGEVTELPNSDLNNTEPTWDVEELGFGYGYDYHMLSGPPLTGATDGGEVGLYGGLFPNFFRNDGRSNNVPYITNIQINTPVVVPNGEIQVSFEAVSGTE